MAFTVACKDKSTVRQWKSFPAVFGTDPHQQCLVLVPSLQETKLKWRKF